MNASWKLDSRVSRCPSLGKKGRVIFDLVKPFIGVFDPSFDVGTVTSPHICPLSCKHTCMFSFQFRAPRLHAIQSHTNSLLFLYRQVSASHTCFFFFAEPPIAPPHSAAYFPHMPLPLYLHSHSTSNDAWSSQTLISLKSKQPSHHKVPTPITLECLLPLPHLFDPHGRRSLASSGQRHCGHYGLTLCFLHLLTSPHVDHHDPPKPADNHGFSHNRYIPWSPTGSLPAN